LLVVQDEKNLGSMVNIFRHYPEKEAAQSWATLFGYLSWRWAKALLMPTHCHVIVKLIHATATAPPPHNISSDLMDSDRQNQTTEVAIQYSVEI